LEICGRLRALALRGICLDFKPFKIGKFLLLERLATGGMAEVYRAKASGAGGFEKQLAIKRILPNYAANEEFRKMFEYEARLSSMLTHSNIVQIYDFVKSGETYLLSMEFVDGKNLRQFINKVKKLNYQLPIQFGVFIVNEICKGLEYAHGKKDDVSGRALNIIHRDMSPQNIMMSYEGAIKIVDFGIAKAKDRVDETRSGVIKGKFGYMSPEQANGENVDTRSDIFSTGIILFELLTMKRLFAADNDMATLKLIQECVFAPPSRTNPKIPVELEKILLKALAKDKNLRYQTAGEFNRAMQEFLSRHFPSFTQNDLSEAVMRVFNEEINNEKKRFEQIHRQSIPFSQGAQKEKDEFEDIENVLDGEMTKSESAANTSATFSGEEDSGEIEAEEASAQAEPAAEGSAALYSPQEFVLDEEASSIGKAGGKTGAGGRPKFKVRPLTLDSVSQNIKLPLPADGSIGTEPQGEKIELESRSERSEVTQLSAENTIFNDDPEMPRVSDRKTKSPPQAASENSVSEVTTPGSMVPESLTGESLPALQTGSIATGLPGVSGQHADRSLNGIGQIASTEPKIFQAPEVSAPPPPRPPTPRHSGVDTQTDHRASSISGISLQVPTQRPLKKEERFEFEEYKEPKSKGLLVVVLFLAVVVTTGFLYHLVLNNQLFAFISMVTKRDLTQRVEPAETAAEATSPLPGKTPGSGETSAAAGSPAAMDCSLDLNSDPAGAQIIIGKDPKGLTPNTVAVPCNQALNVTLKLDNYEVVSENLVMHDRVVKLYKTLKKIPMGTLELTLNQNAQISVDGDAFGQTVPANKPFPLSVRADRRVKVHFRNEVFGVDSYREFTVGTDQVIRESIHFDEAPPLRKR
jgi:serine/threonine protein kinase